MMAPRQYAERAKTMARDALRAGKQVYHHSDIPTRTSYRAQAQQAPRATSLAPSPTQTTRPSFSMNYPYRVGKATSKYISRGVKNVMGMIGRNPKMALSAFGLMLVGKELYQRRLHIAAARSIIDAAGIYLDDKEDETCDAREATRPRVTQKAQRRTQIQQSVRVVERTIHGARSGSRTQTRRVVEQMSGSSPQASRTGTRNSVVPMESVQVSSNNSTTSSSPAYGVGEDSSTLESNHNSTPNSEMEDSDSSAPELTTEQAQRRRDLRAQHRKYIARLARREAALRKRERECLEADVISVRAKEAYDKAQAVEEQAHSTFYQIRGDLALATRKLEKAKGSRNLALDKVEEVEKQREELKLDIYRC